MIYHLRFKRNNETLFTNKYKSKRTLHTGIKLNEPSDSPKDGFKRLTAQSGNIDHLELYIPLLCFTASISIKRFERVFNDIDKLTKLNAVS